jgi:predicted amidophosphoribosyltransferase
MTAFVELFLAVTLVVGVYLIFRGARSRSQRCCSKCGHRQAGSAGFCGQCGAPFP